MRWNLWTWRGWDRAGCHRSDLGPVLVENDGEGYKCKMVRRRSSERMTVGERLPNTRSKRGILEFLPTLGYKVLVAAPGGTRP